MEERSYLKTTVTEDLSQHHHPLGALTHSSSTMEADAFRLSDEQIEFYKENGFLAGVRILSDEQVDKLRAELEDLVDPSHPGNALFYEYNSNESADPNKVLFHALGAWRVTPGFHDILWQPTFLAPAAQLLGGSVRFWHDQLFCKPARDGGVVAWHQDYSYWTRTKPLAHLTCWIALDDSTRENGCVHYVPGSHKWDLLPITGLAGGMQAIQTVLSEEQKKAFHPVPVELKAGEASFHHALMVHGSYENRSERPRRATVINVIKDGVCSHQDSPLLDGVDPIPPGSRMEGRFFPLLYDP